MTDSMARVDDFLADLDAVLNEATALPPPPAIEPEQPREQAPATPVLQPAAEPDWWSTVYDDDRAHEDTFRGHTAADVPPEPDHAPVPAPAEQLDGELADEADAEPDDTGEQDEDGTDAPKKPKKKGKSKGHKGKGKKKGSGGKAAKAAAAEAGIFNNPRGRKVVFAATAYAMGWGLHLDDRATDLMTHAADYALPVAGCALLAGITCLAVSPSKAGCLVLVGSLALIGALEMISPAHVVGGSLALGCQIAYRILRHWVGHFGDRWPWKGVLWAAHIPAATTTVALLLYGTN
ncbi:hypothetical protein ACIPXV_02875 [Streptomyces libani]|uniref:hypothetical protein n=1 Tax=Streptomyces nigrescens TaxID=1920 RepID=UPI00380BCA3A